MPQIPYLLAEGKSMDEIKRKVLFQTMTHEFGHVLNLRHNFYGSFDVSHWQREKNGQVVLRSSSVMDYLNLKEETKSPLRAQFGPYDEAALVYAYSGGKKDLSKERENTLFILYRSSFQLKLFVQPL